MATIKKKMVKRAPVAPRGRKSVIPAPTPPQAVPPMTGPPQQGPPIAKKGAKIKKAAKKVCCGGAKIKKGKK